MPRFDPNRIEFELNRSPLRAPSPEPPQFTPPKWFEGPVLVPPIFAHPFGQPDPTLPDWLRYHPTRDELIEYLRARRERQHDEANRARAEDAPRLAKFIEGLWEKHVAAGGRRPWYR